MHPFHDPRQKEYVDASRWCITREDLDFFEQEVRKLWEDGKIPDDPDPARRSKYHNDPLVGPTMYRVNECYIKPTTAEKGGMSWALWRHPEGLQCDAFATHAWIEGVFEFITRVRSAWPKDAKHLYVCFLANPQNGDISAMLDCDVLDSPFAKALGSAKYMLVIPNRHLSIYLRLWCVLEAYLAITATEDRGLVIKMPIAVAPENWVELMLPGFVMLISGYLLGKCVFHTVLGLYFGPLMWQLTALIVCAVAWILSHVIVQQLGWKVKRKAWFDVILTTLELFIVGMVSGVSIWQLQHFETRSNYEDLSKHNSPITIQQGELVPVAMVTISIVLLHIYNIVLAIDNAVLKLEDAKLKFASVTEAECSDARDEKRIKQTLSAIGSADKIDNAILQLKTVGRYDRDVMYNLERGMCVECLQEGINPFKVVCACFLWSFYWLTDLAGSLEDNVGDLEIEHTIRDIEGLSLVVLIGCCGSLAALALVYWIGEKAIFAISAAFWFGLTFAYISCFDYYWTTLFSVHQSMSRATAGLQLCIFSAMLCADIYFYAGYYADHFCGGCAATDRRIVDRNEIGDVDDDFGLSPLHQELGLDKTLQPARLFRKAQYGSIDDTRNTR